MEPIQTCDHLEEIKLLRTELKNLRYEEHQATFINYLLSICFKIFVGTKFEDYVLNIKKTLQN